MDKDFTGTAQDGQRGSLVFRLWRWAYLRRTPLLILVLGALAFAGWLVWINGSYWWSALKRNPALFEQWSGQTVISTVFLAASGVVVYLVKKVFLGGPGVKASTWDWLKSVAGMLGIWVIVFAFNTFLVAPASMHRESKNSAQSVQSTNAQLLKALEQKDAALSGLSNRVASLTEDASRSQSTNLMRWMQDQTIAVTNEVKRIFAAFEDSERKQEKMMIASGKGSEEALKDIASRTIPIPKLEASDSIRLDDVNSVSAAVEDANAKKAATEELERRKHQPKYQPTDAQTLAASAVIVDFYCKEFENILRKFAEQYGDSVFTTYTNAAWIAAQPVGSDYADIKLAKQKKWSFQIIFRRIGNSNYDWEIYEYSTGGGAPLVKVSFSGEDYRASIAGGISSGKIIELGTALIPKFSWMIGNHKANHPLERIP